RFECALRKTRDYLKKIHAKTVERLGIGHADIFTAHLLVLEDVTLLEEVRSRISAESLNVEFILDELSQRYADLLGAVEDSLFQARTSDLLDVMNRLQRNLLDAERTHVREMAEPSILMAHDLSPSDTVMLDRSMVLGMSLDSGSPTSHTAILARALEIPAVMGLRHAACHINNGTSIIIDGNEGLFIAEPTADTLDAYRQKQRQLEETRVALRGIMSHGSSATRDGVSIPTQANVELPFELVPELRDTAEGVGLFRTEYLFLNRDTLPSEEEQYQAYAQAAETMDPLPVTLRTMDIGGDKFVSHLQISKEENPQLGWRAVRFCLERKDIFKPQLRAMLRASNKGKIQIMFPMISGVEELRQVKAVLSEVKKDLDGEGISYDPDIKVGSMIEVPSAVALADVLSQECDFFSIGTNDLIQYSLAVDRVNEKVAHLYEPAHPAVLRMIKWTCNAAWASGIPCSLCGEMAGNPLYTETLIGMGVTSLSMSAVSLPLVRAEIAEINFGEAQELAARLLQMGTAAEIKTLIEERYEKRGSAEAFISHAVQREKDAPSPLEY
ncbi:MAG: phosphoenolpyruvate--protein phosphotransferase, partial [Candidatus Hydrogenedentes bacterium]|nr:phosphoenolpyruvate--protein phosphotransferase [Candidatus Hydrogenedentota bacterium]